MTAKRNIPEKERGPSVKKRYEIKDNGKNATGRPTAYQEQFNEQAYKLCLLGATDKELADFFEVDEATLNNWKIDFPKFFESIKEGREVADANVSKSLYKRATGYTYTESRTESGTGYVRTSETEKEVPPDPTAAIFWLKNRRPRNWRDKQEVEHSGSIDSEPDLTKLTDQELAEYAKLNRKLRE